MALVEGAKLAYTQSDIHTLDVLIRLQRYEVFLKEVELSCYHAIELQIYEELMARFLIVSKTCASGCEVKFLQELRNKELEIKYFSYLCKLV